VKKTAALSFLFLRGVLFCQPHYYDIPANVPPVYEFQTAAEYQKIISSADSRLNQKELKEYAEALTFAHKRLLESGRIYFNWSGAESYLSALVARISQDLAPGKEFRVFLVRDAEMNASAQDNGIIYINAGLIAGLEDEGVLVSVLAHEISHALHGDTRSIFAAHNNLMRKKGRTGNLLSLRHDNRSLEARADQESFTAATRLGYDISSCHQSFLQFESESRWYKSQYSYQNPKWLIALDKTGKDKDISEDSLEQYLQSHPENSSRIAMLTRSMKAQNGDRRFIEKNKAFFADLRKKARLEQLYISFSEASYKDCLRNAFYYHLLEQDNPDYLWYITESTRRLMMAQPALRKKGFLTEESKERKFENNKGILHDISFLSLDTNFISTVKNDPVYGRIKKPFENYSQAYSFFIKACHTEEVPGCEKISALYDQVFSDAGGAGRLKGNRKISKQASDSLAELLAGKPFAGQSLVYVKRPEYYSGTLKNIRYSFSESDNQAGKINLRIIKEWNSLGGDRKRFVFENKMSADSLCLFENLAGNFEAFKSEKQADAEGRSAFGQDETYRKNKQLQEPFSSEVIERRKDFFNFAPEFLTLFSKAAIHSFVVIKPYLFRHRSGTYVFFEISYFDPVNRKYVYLNQEFAGKYRERNIRKLFREFYKKLEEPKEGD
jgi:Zn-dependent protease with chaperone function